MNSDSSTPFNVTNTTIDTAYTAPDSSMDGPTGVTVTKHPFLTVNDQFLRLNVAKKEDRASTSTKKEFLHHALIRNDMNVPDLHAPICTKKFLNECKNETVFMFGVHIIKKLPCPQPPPLHQLNRLVTDNLTKAHSVPGIVPNTDSWNRLIRHLKARPADKHWCLEVLATLHQVVPCEIFDEGYFYSKTPAKMKPVISEEDFLFYGRLPERQQILA
jgi:hypothetical protein